jgi:putative FmdB family regulatory protein
MPIYTYKCVSCGFAQDEMQKMSDALLTVCPSCGKADYAKQVTAAGFALKGTGWYATDFKDSGSKPAAAKPEAPSPACGTGACPACN